MKKGIGLGVYDIHSPRVPSKDEMYKIVEQSLEVCDPKYFWINPDCGLKNEKNRRSYSSFRTYGASSERCSFPFKNKRITKNGLSFSQDNPFFILYFQKKNSYCILYNSSSVGSSRGIACNTTVYSPFGIGI